MSPLSIFIIPLPTSLGGLGELLVLLLIGYIFFRRMSVRDVGKKVGRATASSRPEIPVQAPQFENKLVACFSALDLKPNASYDEVKIAYRELAKVWHPDRFVQDEKLQARANVKLAEINAAYLCLKEHFEK